MRKLFALLSLALLLGGCLPGSDTDTPPADDSSTTAEEDVINPSDPAAEEVTE